MLDDRQSNQYAAKFSLLKISALDIFMAAIGIAPNLPGFGRDLVYTRFFYENSFIRITCSFIILFLVFATLPLLIRAISGKPALAVRKDDIVVFTSKEIEIDRRRVTKIVGPTWYGIMKIVSDGEIRPTELPVFLYQNQKEAVRELKKLS